MKLSETEQKKSPRVSFNSIDYANDRRRAADFHQAED